MMEDEKVEQECSALKDFDEVSPNWVIRKVYFFVTPLIFVAGFLSYLDRSSVSFGALQFQKDLRLSSADYGLGTALFYIGYGFFQVPACMVQFRVGAPLWLAGLLAGWGLVSLCTAFMKKRGQFFALRFFLGLVEAGYFPGSWYHMSRFLTSTELAVAYGAVISSTALGQMLGAPIAAGILLMDGLKGLRGWQWLFLLEGAATMAYAPIFFLTLARGPYTAWFLKPQERAWLGSRQDTLTESARKRNPRAGVWWGVFTNWRTWYLSSCFLLIQFSIVAIVYFNPILVRAMFSGSWDGSSAASKKFTTEREQVLYQARIALISSVLWVPVALASVLSAMSVKYFRGERNLHCTIPLIVAGVSYILVPTMVQKAGPIAGYAFLIIGATGVEATYGPIIGWSRSYFFGESSAIAAAFGNSFACIGGFAGPFVMGKLVSLPGGYSTAMIVMGSVNLFNAIALYFFRPGTVEDQEVIDSWHKVGSREMRRPALNGSAPATNADAATDTGSDLQSTTSATSSPQKAPATIA